MSDRYYTDTHEWVTVDAGVATIGITDFAQGQLGDVVYLELPQVGKMLEAGDTLGVIESVKAASDLYSPVSGKVVEANAQLADKPEVINQDPYGGGWMLKLELAEPHSSELLEESAYTAFTEGL